MTTTAVSILIFFLVAIAFIVTVAISVPLGISLIVLLVFVYVPIHESIRGQRYLGDWVYPDTVALSKSDQNRAHKFLQENAGTLEQHCKPQVADFLLEPTMGNVRAIGYCWRNIPATSLHERFVGGTL